jgi:hypothetical protein
LLIGRISPNVPLYGENVPVDPVTAKSPNVVERQVESPGWLQLKVIDAAPMVPEVEKWSWLPVITAPKDIAGKTTAPARNSVEQK